MEKFKRISHPPEEDIDRRVNASSHWDKICLVSWGTIGRRTGIKYMEK
jgi:hypothetical protein